MIYVNKEVTIRDYTESRIGFLFQVKAEGAGERERGFMRVKIDDKETRVFEIEPGTEAYLDEFLPDLKGKKVSKLEVEIWKEEKCESH